MPLPISCTLSATELGARRAHLLPGLFARATSGVVLDAGYRLTFSPAAGLLESIARVVDAERQCCRFLRFALVIEPGGAAITLDVTGPEGTLEFLKDLLQAGGTEVPPPASSRDATIQSA